MRALLLALLLLGAVSGPSSAFAAGGGDEEGAPATPAPPDEDILRPNFVILSRWYVQLDLGVNFTFLSIPDSSTFVKTRTIRWVLPREGPITMLSSGTGIGLLASLSVGYNFPDILGIKDVFGVRIRGDYDVRSAGNSEVTTDNCSSSTDQTVNKNYTVTYDYLTISLMPTINYKNFTLFFGVGYGFPIYGKYHEVHSGGCTYFPGQADQTNSIRILHDSLKPNTRTSVKIGVGYTYPLAKGISLVPQIGFDYGLQERLFDANPKTGFVNGEKPINSETVSINSKQIINAFQLSVGVRFSFADYMREPEVADEK